MTPQDLLNETRPILDADIKKYQETQEQIKSLQDQLNQLLTKIVGNQKLVEGLQKVLDA
tara:strand:+ start:1171 stop:1347 length:177 start_codon:yes stop_codon:yes gene_type:complete